MRLRRPATTDTYNRTENEDVCIFILDGTTLSCPRHALTIWSREFENHIQTDNELVLNEFYGNAKEVSECIALLEGREVDVNFENVKVITKFAIKFNIDRLLQELKTWFQSSLSSMATFSQTLMILYHIETFGFNATVHFDKIILGFVNNQSPAQINNMIEQTFGELDTIILKILLTPNNTHLNGLLHIIATKISTEKQCRLALQQLESILAAEYAELLANSTEVVMVMNKISDIAVQVDLIRSAARLMTKLFEVSQTTLPPDRIGLELMQRLRQWRQYSHQEILELHKNPELKEWHYTEVIIDWIKMQDQPPPRETIMELLSSITRHKLPHDYVKAVSLHFDQILAFFGYRKAAWWGGRWGNEYTSKMNIKLSEDECIVLQNSSVARLRFQKCLLAGCPSRSLSKAVVSLQLINSSGNASMNVVPSTPNPDDHEHSANAYRYWYMTTTAGHFYSFFTCTFGEITTVFGEHRSDISLHAFTVHGSFYEENCSVS